MKQLKHRNQSTTKESGEIMPNNNFSKYDFVKSYIKNAKTSKQKLEKEEEASLIADAIRKNNHFNIENLASKTEAYQIRDELKGEIVCVRTELYQVRDELRGEIAQVRDELKGDIAQLRTELKGEISQLRDEVKTDIALVRKDMIIMEKNLTIKITFIVGALLSLSQAFSKFIG